MRDNFDKALKFVFADEGPFSDIPADRGGPTNQGITLKTLMDYHAHFDYGDFDQDGDIDIDDIYLLDEQGEAAPIYRKWFWDVVSGDDLPSGIDYVVFDSSVNHGPRTAGSLLQRAVNRMGYGLTVDGWIGPVTIQGVLWADPEILITNTLRERDIFYRKIVAQDPSQLTFINGWMNRLAKIAVNVREFTA